MHKALMHQKTDKSLFVAAVNGEAEAFHEIVERHKAMVYRTCLRILGNSTNAEDAVQATFIVFYQKRQELNHDIVLGGWLYRTAELVCREYIRSSNRRKRREAEAASMNETSNQNSVQVWNELQPDLDAAMMALPQKYRDVVVLRFLEEKTTSETAIEMGISDSAVTTRLARALERLHAWFERRGMVLGAGALSVVLADNAAAATVPSTLTPSIVSTTGAVTMTTGISTNTSLMVKGTLAKMASVTWYVFNALLLVAWIDCMVSWVRKRLSNSTLGTYRVGQSVWNRCGDCCNLGNDGYSQFFARFCLHLAATGRDIPWLVMDVWTGTRNRIKRE